MKIQFMTATIILITALTVLNSCDHNITGPIADTPGKRDYIWKVDTLDCPFNTAFRIWGISPIDVWVTTVPGDMDKTIFHFDGKKWSTDGIPRPLSPGGVWGFASDDVYIAGETDIWHYDGKTLKELTNFRNDSIFIRFNGIWGENNKNIYSFGASSDSNGLLNNSYMVNYKNNKWVKVNMGNVKGIIKKFYYDDYSKKHYLSLGRMWNGLYRDSTLIYEYSGSNFKYIQGSIWDKGTESNISLVNGDVYFVLGKQIAKRAGTEFKTIVEVNSPNFYQRIWGRSSKDIFLFMTDGLAHYNGSDIAYLFYYTDRFSLPFPQIMGAAIFETEVFFIVYEPQTGLSLIYHGKLIN
ncbi:MAG: hypothetical protein HUU54_15550 [Ignavibacteriaceae bacterium]|nr:hypothetical protein [Ignavibacteriaceae bacterium]